MSFTPELAQKEMRCWQSTGRPTGGPCLGAKCMAWRWSRAKETKAYLDAVQAEMKASSTNFNVASNKVWAELGSTFEKAEGYCGLAGKPE
jgi:hypothetical protein